MSRLSELRISSLRNIEQANLDCHPRFNLIHGKNGSGKTSILEAISLVAQGKSFRTTHTDSLINSDSSEALVFARLEDGHRIGIKRARSGYQLNLDGQTQSNWDAVLKMIPILVLDSGAFTLLEGGPRSRRQFLDWGTFHVEPGFISAWRRTRRCLSNRNQLLKSSAVDWALIEAWDQEFILAADEVNRARSLYLDRLLPVFNAVYGALLPDLSHELALSYEPGWDPDLGLERALRNSREADIKYRATQYGPQRADIAIMAGKKSAVEVLSRGQQKMLVGALKLAQGMVQGQAGELDCIYLVDDLAAELDSENRAAVVSFLMELESQLFITCIEVNDFVKGLPAEPEMGLFHVERGKISVTRVHQ